MGRSSLLVAALGLWAGCAGASSAQRAPAAERIYAAAESRVEQGAAGEAALLMRHALLQLPADASADELRHALILRIAYVEMLAWADSGNRVHLEDAERMLLRYLERHEALFGDQEPRSVARADVYEILYEVERRLEEADVEAETPGPGARVAGDGGSSAPLARGMPSEPPPAAPVADSGDEASAVTSQAEGDVRVVRVRTRSRPDVDDSETRRLLKSAFSNPFPEAGMVLTAAGMVQLHGPRPLVRLGGIARSVEADSFEHHRHARVLARALVRSARLELRECLAGAFARRPVATSAASTVELSIHPDGSVSGVRIVDGGLIDGLGDVCLIEGLTGARVEDAELVASERVRIPLEFVYQGAVMIHEADGRVPDPSRPPPQTSTAPAGHSDPPLIR